MLRGWPSAEHASCRVSTHLNLERILWLRKRRRRKRPRRRRRPRRSSFQARVEPRSARATNYGNRYFIKSGGPRARLFILALKLPVVLANRRIVWRRRAQQLLPIQFSNSRIVRRHSFAISPRTRASFAWN